MISSLSPLASYSTAVRLFDAILSSISSYIAKSTGFSHKSLFFLSFFSRGVNKTPATRTQKKEHNFWVFSRSVRDSLLGYAAAALNAPPVFNSRALCLVWLFAPFVCVYTSLLQISHPLSVCSYSSYKSNDIRCMKRRREFILVLCLSSREREQYTNSQGKHEEETNGAADGYVFLFFFEAKLKGLWCRHAYNFLLFPRTNVRRIAA